MWYYQYYKLICKGQEKPKLDEVYFVQTLVQMHMACIPADHQNEV